MKLFQKLLVAPAALGLLAPAAVNASELNIDGVSDYAATGEQVTSITQFSDVYPTDWAYQALSNLIERYGCVAGYPNGTYRGNRAMTRFEAAALLNACLDRITEVTDELKRLMKEFEKELAILKGRVDGLEARVGELEATQFSTTTKLKGQTTFVIGAVNAGGDNGSKYFRRDEANFYSVQAYGASLGYDEKGEYVLPNRLILTGNNRNTYDRRSNRNTVFSKTGRNGGASAYNRTNGATTFSYDQRLKFVTSFTGKDTLMAVLRAGNFDNAFNPSGSSDVNLTRLDVATNTSDNVKLVRLWYKFPVGEEFTFIVGAKARNTESLAVWPSVYNKGGAKILDWTALMGTSGVYNKATGSLVGGYWKQSVDKGDNAFSVSLNYVTPKGSNGNSATGGFMTSNSAASVLAQIGYAGPQWGVTAAYRYGQCGSSLRGSTSFVDTNTSNNLCLDSKYRTYSIDGKKFYLKTIDKNETLKDGTKVVYESSRTNSDSNSFALNAYWQPEESGWIPSFSVGWALNTVSSDDKKAGSVIESQSWMVGLKWDDVLLKGNAMGFAFGQPTFATSKKSCPKGGDVYTGVFDTAGLLDYSVEKCSDSTYDGNYVFEWYYNFQVTDNIAITPSVFYLSRPMGQNTNNLVEGGQGYDGQFNVFGGLVQTQFKF